MTDAEEIRILRLERNNARLVAKLAKYEKQIADLQKMHDANQRYIGKLQAQVKRAAATAIFSEGQ